MSGRANRLVQRARRLAGRLRRDQSGLALLEFAFATPLVLGVGLYAAETANLALANMRISQIALNLADNASRVGLSTSDNTKQMREIDINDVLAATRLQGEPLDLTGRGRIILSSLEESGGKQMIHWQRCLGVMSGADYVSHFGTTKPSDGTTTNSADAGTEVSGGMGPTGAKVVAPPASGVMYVEINYLYRPVVSTAWLPGGSARLQYTASFIVRDRRAFEQIYNPQPAATRMTCDKYTAS